MGLFTSIIGSGLLGGITSLIGGERANEARQDEAETNRSFQEMSARHRHQWEVEDLRRAGLNPILSAHSQPPVLSGNMAHIEDTLSPAVSTAMQMRRLSADLKKVREETALTNQLIDESEARQKQADESAANTAVETRLLTTQLPGALNRARTEDSPIGRYASDAEAVGRILNVINPVKGLTPYNPMRSSIKFKPKN